MFQNRTQTISQIKDAVNNLGHEFYDVDITETNFYVFIYVLQSFDKDVELLPLINSIKSVIALSHCNEISSLKLNLFIYKCK